MLNIDNEIFLQKPKSKKKVRRRSKFSYKQKLNKIIMFAANIYYNNVVKRKTDVLTIQTRVDIIKIFIDYYDVVGKTNSLVNNIIRCNIWGLLALINKRTPIQGNDISLTNINEEQCMNLNKLGISLTSDIKTLFTYNTTETILKYLTEHDVFPNGVSIDDFRYIREPTLLKYMCDNNKISLKKKDIRKCHKKCYLVQLNYLISENLISVTNNDVRSIFRKIIIKKQNRCIGRVDGRRIYTRVRRRRRRRADKNCNSNTKNPDFKNGINKYIDLITEKKLSIPSEICVKDTFMSRRLYESFMKIIELKEKNSFRFSSYEKIRLFEHLVKTDSIDKIKTLFDKNVIMINELHQNSTYVSNCLEYNAEKVLKYIINDFRVKFSFAKSHSVWALFVGNNSEIISRLKLIKSVEIPVPETLMSFALRERASSTIIDFLISDFSLKIEKCHISYLIRYPVRIFNKFTKSLDYNKKQVIQSIIRKTGYYYRNGNVKIALHLMSKLTKKEKVKLIPKYALTALCANTKFFEEIKKRFNVPIDLQLVKKLLSENKLNTNGVYILNNFINPDTEKKDITEIKEIFTNDELCKLIVNAKYGISSLQKTMIFIQKLKISINIPLLETLIFNFSHAMLPNKTLKSIVNIIKLSDEYQNNVEELCELLLKDYQYNGLYIVTELHDSNHNYIKFLTKKYINEIIANSCSNGPTIDIILDIIENNDLNHLITPYVYTIIQKFISYDRYYHSVNKSDLSRLIAIEKHISRDDYNVLKELCGPSDSDCFIDDFQFEIIDDFKADPKDIPTCVSFYINNPYLDYDLNNPNLDNNSDYSSHDKSFNNDREILADVDKALNEAMITNANDIDNIKTNTFDDDTISIDDNYKNHIVNQDKLENKTNNNINTDEKANTKRKTLVYKKN